MNYLILLASEGVNPVKSVGNIFFYVLLAALVVALVTICLIFTRSKSFKVRLREKMKAKEDKYEVPHLVKVYDKQVKDELQYNIERELKEQAEEAEKVRLEKEKNNGELISSHIINYKMGESQEFKDIESDE